jgi:hypothetical protein
MNNQVRKLINFTYKSRLIHYHLIMLVSCRKRYLCALLKAGWLRTANSGLIKSAMSSEAHPHLSLGKSKLAWNYRVLQKRHRPLHDKASELSFDTAMYLHEYKNLHENTRWESKMNRNREKNTYSQTSRLENPEELQLHHNHKKFQFLTVLLLFAQ